MDSVELAHAMAGLAAGTRAFYLALLDEGFDATQALALTTTWLFGTAGGKQG